MKIIFLFLIVIGFNLDVFGQITLGFASTESRCQSSGTITVTASGGATPYLYEITAGPVTRTQQVPNIFNALPAGSYTVLVTDNLGATQSGNITVSGSYITPTATASTSDESCLGNDGSLTINVMGGRAPYIYELVTPSPVTAGPQASNFFSNLSSGSYTIRVTDSCGNFYTFNHSVFAQDYSNMQRIYSNYIDFYCDSFDLRAWKSTDTVSYDKYQYPLTFMAINVTDNDTIVSKKVTNNFTDTIRLPRYKSYKVMLIDTCGNFDDYWLYSQPRVNSPSVSFDCSNGFYYFLLSNSYFSDSNKTYQIISGPVTTPVQDSNFFDSLVPGSYVAEVCDCDTCITRSFSITNFSLTSMNLSAYQACDTGRGRLRVDFNSSVAYPIATVLAGPPNFPFPIPYTDTSTSANASSFTFYDFPKGTYTIAVRDTCGRADTLTYTPNGGVMALSTNVSYSVNCGSNTFEIRDTGYYRKNASGFWLRLLDSNSNILQSNYLPLTYPGGSVGTGVSTFNEVFTVSNPGTYYIRYDFFYSFCPTIYRYDTIVIDTTATSTQISNIFPFICKDSSSGRVIIDAFGGVAPLSYEIFSGPITFPPQFDSSFNGLPIGVYQARVYDACGISTTLGFEVTPYGQSSINFSNPVCLGSNFFALADTLPGALYQWTGPNSYLSNNRRLSLTPLTINDTGLYYLDVDFGTCIDTIISFRVIGDLVPPNAICKDTVVYLDGSGLVSIDSSFIDNGSNDSCGNITASVSRTTFTCSDVGINNVTLVVSDMIGNIDSCSANVTVYDTLRPIPQCQNITVYLNASSVASITAGQIDNGSTDNCGVASMSIFPSNFNCSNIGANTVTLIVTDVNGNIDSCTSVVTVVDTFSTTGTCKDTSVYLNIGGSFTIDSSFVITGIGGGCGSVASATISQSVFGCADIGTNTINVLINGSINCTANITVYDTIRPTPQCQNISVQLDTLGNVSITAAQIDNGSTDNCAIASMTVSPNSFTCANIGANTVTLIVTDVNGNIDSCSAIVTVDDTISPIVQTNNIIVYLDSNGSIGIVPSQIDNGSTDNCAIASMAVVPNSFNCNDIGLNNVTLTVTDVNGNFSAGIATVDVRDDIAPWFSSCPVNVIDTLRNSCDYVVPNFTNGLAFYDNCDTASAVVTQTPLPGTIIQANQDGSPTNIIVNVDVVDAGLNLSTCIHQLTLVCYSEIQIPEFISPNNDGQNDVWFIKGIEAFGDHNIKVFNRFGNLVFESSDYQNDWNGSALKGTIFSRTTDDILPSGTYYYIITTNLFEEKVYKGYLYIRK